MSSFTSESQFVGSSWLLIIKKKKFHSVFFWEYFSNNDRVNWKNKISYFNFVSADGIS